MDHVHLKRICILQSLNVRTAKHQGSCISQCSLEKQNQQHRLYIWNWVKWSLRLTSHNVCNWQASWRPRRANGVDPVPLTVWRPEIQEELLFQFKSEGREKRISQLSGSQEGGAPSFFTLFLLFRPLKVWTRPTHIREVNRLHSAYHFKWYSHPETPAQTQLQ